MERLIYLAKGMNNRFPNGNTPYQIMTRLLEECGEVAQEVNRYENSGTKVLRHGEGSKEDLANEIKDSLNALIQLALYYDAIDEVVLEIEKSINRLIQEGYLQTERKGELTKIEINPIKNETRKVDHDSIFSIVNDAIEEVAEFSATKISNTRLSNHLGLITLEIQKSIERELKAIGGKYPICISNGHKLEEHIFQEMKKSEKYKLLDEELIIRQGYHTKLFFICFTPYDVCTGGFKTENEAKEFLAYMLLEKTYLDPNRVWMNGDAI